MVVADNAEFTSLIHKLYNGLRVCASLIHPITWDKVTFSWHSAKTCDLPAIYFSHKDRSKITLRLPAAVEGLDTLNTVEKNEGLSYWARSHLALVHVAGSDREYE